MNLQKTSHVHKEFTISVEDVGQEQAGRGSKYFLCGLIFVKPCRCNGFFKVYLFIFRVRGREGDREGEKHQCVVSSSVPPTRDLARNPGMCPDGELKQ